MTSWCWRGWQQWHKLVKITEIWLSGKGETTWKCLGRSTWKFTPELSMSERDGVLSREEFWLKAVTFSPLNLPRIKKPWTSRLSSLRLMTSKSKVKVQMRRHAANENYVNVRGYEADKITITYVIHILRKTIEKKAIYPIEADGKAVRSEGLWAQRA